jgi:hypothetical protein
MVGPTEYLRIVVDPIRLAILGRAASGPVDAAQLAVEIGEDPRKVRREAGRLVEAGLLTRSFDLDRDTLTRIARELPQAAPMDPALAAGPWTEEEAEVLSRFFSGSRLTQIPTQRAKRMLVLERLALEFEPGLRYPEREVNSTLQLFHPDYASLRRFMVDEGLLTRAEGVYWRSGGRVAAP